MRTTWKPFTSLLTLTFLFLVGCSDSDLETGWYESGKKKYETHYKNGKKEGVEKYWYESGRKKSLKHYKNGIENGIRKEWDEDGKRTFQGNFVDGNEE